jgi:hypothetical protein
LVGDPERFRHAGGVANRDVIHQQQQYNRRHPLFQGDRGEQRRGRRAVSMGNGGGRIRHEQHYGKTGCADGRDRGEEPRGLNRRAGELERGERRDQLQGILVGDSERFRHAGGIANRDVIYQQQQYNRRHPLFQGDRGERRRGRRVVSMGNGRGRIRYEQHYGKTGCADRRDRGEEPRGLD